MLCCPVFSLCRVALSFCCVVLPSLFVVLCCFVFLLCCVALSFRCVVLLCLSVVLCVVLPCLSKHVMDD